MKLCVVLLLAIVGVSVGEECQRMCTMEYAPVCGSDGKTYGNKCSLESQACFSKSGVTLDYEGECGPRLRSCERPCTKILARVCGSDGVTYSNECEMKNAACRSDTPITVARDGEC